MRAWGKGCDDEPDQRRAETAAADEGAKRQELALHTAGLRMRRRHGGGWRGRDHLVAISMGMDHGHGHLCGDVVCEITLISRESTFG